MDVWTFDTGLVSIREALEYVGQYSPIIPDDIIPVRLQCLSHCLLLKSAYRWREEVEYGTDTNQKRAKHRWRWQGMQRPYPVCFQRYRVDEVDVRRWSLATGFSGLLQERDHLFQPFGIQRLGSSEAIVDHHLKLLQMAGAVTRNAGPTFFIMFHGA